MSVHSRSIEFGMKVCSLTTTLDSAQWMSLPNGFNIRWTRWRNYVRKRASQHRYVVWTPLFRRSGPGSKRLSKMPSKKKKEASCGEQEASGFTVLWTSRTCVLVVLIPRMLADECFSNRPLRYHPFHSPGRTRYQNTV